MCVVERSGFRDCLAGLVTHQWTPGLLDNGTWKHECMCTMVDGSWTDWFWKLNCRPPGMQKLFTFRLDLGACSSIKRTRPNRASCGTPSASLVHTRFVFRETPRETTTDVVGHDCQVAGRLASEEVRQPPELVILVDPPLI